MEYDTIFVAARRAGNELALVDAGRLSRTVAKAAALLRENAGKVLAANALDLEAMDADSPMRDRLRLTAERIASIAADMESVAGLPSPQGETIAEWTRPNGMTLRKVRVPFGVVGMICEARPNVTADIFSLSMKTGNACVLKGGSDARRSNEAIAALLREALRSEGIDPAAFTLLPAGHEAAGALLNAVGYVDVVIPRGGAGLIRFVRENARIPVIETGAGIVHTYFDLDGDLTKGRAVVCNAKTRRVSVCNALDCLIVHRERLRDLAELCDPMAAERVTVYADAEAYAALEGRYPACLLRPAAEEHFGTEFLDYKLAVRTVGSLDEALAHIARYSSHRKRRDGPGVHPAGRCGVRLRQRLDGLHRRRPVRVRRRGRHFDPETPRPRPDGAARTHDLQIRDFRQRTDQRAMTVTPPPAVFAASRRVPDSAPHGRSEVAAHRCIPRRPSRKGNAAAWPGRPAPKDPDAICDKNSTYFGK